MTTTTAADRARAALAREARQRGVGLVVMFGSTARGNERPDSDVDVGVLGGGFWEQLAVGTAVGDALGRDPHVVDLATASERLQFEVARDGVLLFEDRSGRWVDFITGAVMRWWDLAPMVERATAAVRDRLRAEALRRLEGTRG